MTTTRFALVASAAALLLLAPSPAVAEGDVYRRPPAEIVKILEAPPLPAVVLDPRRERMLLVERVTLPPIRDLAEPMLRLAGERVNPKTGGPHGPRQFVGLRLKRISDGAETPVKLPADPHVGMPFWSPDGARFAFTLTRETGIVLWVGDAATGEARAVTGPTLNAILGAPARWMPDSRRLVCRFVPEGRAAAPPERPAAPGGPVVQESRGRTSPVRTYQDLLRDAPDEALFEHFMTSQLAIVDGASGERVNLGGPAIHAQVDPSPSGAYLLVSRVVRPYSYLVPASLFPEIVEVRSAATGALVRELARVPLRDEVPIQGVEKGPRGFDWRDTAPAELVWAEALDDGDPRKKVPHRDRVLSLAEPFEGPGRERFKTEHRFRGLSWLAAGGLALAAEYDRDRRWTRAWLHDLDAKEPAAPRLVWDRSVNDRYGDPGTPLRTVNAAGRSVIRVHDGAIYLAGNGSTPEGDRPFLDRLRLADLATARLWRCEGATLESAVDVLAPDASRVLTRFETPTEPPNYFVRDLAAGGGRKAVTAFKDPAPELRAAPKRLVTYARPDGVTLSATLYLPPDRKPGERLPLLVWAYPLEYNDPATAGQVSGSPHAFTPIGGASHLFLLTQGYAIMDAATMPVIGHPETVNDTFVPQIVASAKAAIDEAVALGVADRQRVAVGGHSYGAFMTASLLAHSDLFRAGVARSGAYNRSLTPFGFQGERRTFWEATDAYVHLSPFTHANKIDEPLLMIHGQNDSNSGTFPMQSERLYHAVKGHGGTARLVLLPYEDHGYRARESVLHTLAEMIAWLDEHVKGARAN